MVITCHGRNLVGEYSETSKPFRLVLEHGPTILEEFEQMVDYYYKKNSLGSEGCLKMFEDFFRFRAHRGRVFASNLTGWHLLWDFVCEVGRDILTDKQMLHGHNYSGTGIIEQECIAEQCLGLSEKIEEQINTGYVRAIERESKEHYDLRPKMPCPICKGTGLMKIFTDQKKMRCPSCNGDGQRIYCNFREEWEFFSEENMEKFNIFLKNWKYFSEDNVKTFNMFLKNCGGFVIC